MNSIREALSELSKKPVTEITDATPIRDLFPEGRASQGAFIARLGELCGVELKPSHIVGLTKVEELEIEIQHKRVVEPVRLIPFSNEHYSAAVTLYAHYSTVRASLVTALLAISAAFSAYLVRYIQEAVASEQGPSFWVIVVFVFFIQLGFSIAALITSIWLGSLRRRTQDFLENLEAGKRIDRSSATPGDSPPFDPTEVVDDRYFHYLISPVLARFHFSDLMDKLLFWLVLISQLLIVVGMFSLHVIRAFS